MGLILPKIEIVHTIPEDEGTVRIQSNRMVAFRGVNDFYITGREKRVGGVAATSNSLQGRAMWLSPDFNWTLGFLPGDEYIYLVPTRK